VSRTMLTTVIVVVVIIVLVIVLVQFLRYDSRPGRSGSGLYNALGRAF
jgi:preprotein translocase subunit SecG